MKDEWLKMNNEWWIMKDEALNELWTINDKRWMMNGWMNDE